MKDLPPPIAAYFAAQKADDDLALAACFSPDALVHDEARDHQGREAIMAWRRETREKTPFTSKVLNWKPVADDFVVTVEVAGDFPNSPVRLDQRFTLVDGYISALDIR